MLTFGPGVDPMIRRRESDKRPNRIRAGASTFGIFCKPPTMRPPMSIPRALTNQRHPESLSSVRVAAGSSVRAKGRDGTGGWP